MWWKAIVRAHPNYEEFNLEMSYQTDLNTCLCKYSDLYDGIEHALEQRACPAAQLQQRL